MQIIFRKRETTDAPAAGELLIESRGAGQVTGGVAELAFDEGVAAFSQGAGPIQTLVVDYDPTFDDMLASLFVEELLAGRELPRGAQSFAHYARRRREGRTPSSLPLEVSMEGIYLAIRNASDGDLTKPKTAAKFLRDWRRMADVILKAAAAGENPFNTPLFSDGHEFADERASLAADRAVFRQDVLRGEQWIVDIPGAARRSRALFLRKPTSLLFPQWSRREGDSGADRPYIFLAVDWGKGYWMFSTDPEQRLRLDSLAEVLQQAEAATDPASAAIKPWGKRSDDTLVYHRHSKMTNDKVLSVVKHWAHARRPPSPKPIPAWVAIAAVVLFGIVSWGVGMFGGIRVRQANVREQTAVAKSLPDDSNGSDASLRTYLKGIQDSVYLVFEQDSGGGLHAEATAWVVDQTKGILVTNAHVAALYDQAKARGGNLLVRSRGNQQGDFVVKRTKIHPGYSEWRRLWQTAVERSPGTGAAQSTEPPVNLCDVALLYVDPTQGLGAALTFADDPTLQHLDKVGKIGFVGYLIDNNANPGVNTEHPDPSAETGEIVAMTDYFGNPNGDFTQQLLIQHNIPTSGGASGSPILNDNGKVIGVHSSGNYIFIPGWSGRIPAGLHYAQRADLVEELLGPDDRAAETQKSRTEKWKAELDSNKDAAQFLELISDWKAWVDKQVDPGDSRAPVVAVDLVNIVATLSDQPQSDSAGTDERYRSTLSFAVDGTGVLIVAAYTASAPSLAMKVYPVKDGARQRDPLPTQFDGKRSHPYAVTDVDGTQLFEVELAGGENADYSLRASMVQLTLQQKRQALALDWIAHGSAKNTAQVEPVQVLDLPGQTAENSDRFLSTIDITGLSGDPKTGSEYFAVANAANGENLQLQITAAAKSAAAPSPDDAPSPWPHHSFTAKNGDRVQVTVVGPAAGIKFDVVIYAAGPKPAAK